MGAISLFIRFFFETVMAAHVHVALGYGEPEVIRTLLIADDPETTRLLSSLVLSSGELTLERTIPLAPGSYLLTKALQTHRIDVALLEASDATKSLRTLEHVKEVTPGVPVISVNLNGHSSPTAYSLALPLSNADLMHTVRSAVHDADKISKASITAILPAKGGCGASTVTINAAARLAANFGKKVLVCEADLHSGIIADVLDLEPKASMQQTLDAADNAEGLIWPRHICHKSGVEFILTRRGQSAFRPRWHNYRQLINFVSQRYDSVLVDLPEHLDDATSEVVLAAKKVHLVTTPEIVSLKLAQGRVAELRSMGVAQSALKIVVNRHHKTDVEARHIEEILDCTVEAVLPNNYPLIQAATRNRTFVDSYTELGRSFERYASTIVNGAKPAAVRKRSLFSFLRPSRSYEESFVVQRADA